MQSVNCIWYMRYLNINMFKTLRVYVSLYQKYNGQQQITLNIIANAQLNLNPTTAVSVTSRRKRATRVRKFILL